MLEEIKLWNRKIKRGSMTYVILAFEVTKERSERSLVILVAAPLFLLPSSERELERYVRMLRR